MVKRSIADSFVQEVINNAAKTACEELDIEFPGYDNKENPGITSNFQGLLHKVIEKMLTGEDPTNSGTYLPSLVNKVEG